MILIDKTFFLTIDENPNLLGFDDGIYETDKKQFRKGVPTDYVTKSVGYDYPLKDSYGYEKVSNYF